MRTIPGMCGYRLPVSASVTGPRTLSRKALIGPARISSGVGRRQRRGDVAGDSAHRLAWSRGTPAAASEGNILREPHHDQVRSRGLARLSGSRYAILYRTAMGGAPCPDSSLHVISGR
jgi:hypothetical protein